MILFFTVGSNNHDIIENNYMVPFALDNLNECTNNDNNNDSIENQNEFTEISGLNFKINV